MDIFIIYFDENILYKSLMMQLGYNISSHHGDVRQG